MREPNAEPLSHQAHRASNNLFEPQPIPVPTAACYAGQSLAMPHMQRRIPVCIRHNVVQVRKVVRNEVIHQALQLV